MSINFTVLRLDRRRYEFTNEVVGTTAAAAAVLYLHCHLEEMFCFAFLVTHFKRHFLKRMIIYYIQ